MSLGNYIKQLTKFVLSSSIVLGLIVGVSVLIAGETTIEIDLTLEFGPFDSVWWIVGLPIISTLICVILSPLSFLIYRLSSRRRTGDVLSNS
jgi:amino acid transporter